MSLKSGFVVTTFENEIYRVIAVGYTGAVSKMKNDHDVEEVNIKSIEMNKAPQSL